MQRVDAPEILDSESCPEEEVQAALQTLDRINRWFGGVSTTQKLVERAAVASGEKHFSLLEVAAGSGKVPVAVQQKLASRGIHLDVMLLDRIPSHLPGRRGAQGGRDSKKWLSRPDSVVGDALALPFGDESFDFVSCNLFAHHLTPLQLGQFIREALRASRVALLINDLIRHPLHLALVYASYPMMGSRVAWRDGLTSVRRAYVPEEIRGIVTSASPHRRVEIIRNYLFRMGVIVWKREN
jgi:ubiquinone/menaquinone biosynthesis C-methylase UbiE